MNQGVKQTLPLISNPVDACHSNGVTAPIILTHKTIFTMRCIIESPGLQLDKRVENLVQLKFKGLEKIYDRTTNCRVVMRKENNEQKKDFLVRAQLAVPKKALYAHCKAETFKIALHKVVDNLAHQLQRHKKEREETW